jgi:hypothetical protein
MKQLIAIIATAFAVTSFAAEPAKKEEAKPAAPAVATSPAPAPAVKADVKSKTKAAPAKKDDKKPADPATATKK